MGSLCSRVKDKDDVSLQLAVLSARHEKLEYVEQMKMVKRLEKLDHLNSQIMTNTRGCEDSAARSRYDTPISSRKKKDHHAQWLWAYENEEK